MPENTSPERPNRRAENKARTRQKVLEAAKRLFMQRGYEGATMRDIAADAGLSTGALFANFTDKADLFNEVVLTDFEIQHERIAKAIAGADTAKAKIMAMMSSGYEFHLSQLPLLQAGISVSWSHGLNGELGERPVWKTVTGYLVEILEEGSRKGELKAEFDHALLADIIWDTYLANYRRAVFGDWGLEQLKARLEQQVDLLLSAVRK